ncbi:MAG: aspartate--tRNA ligase [Proteobacteria bacterium]|nr:aspartate--tRNA ligase [Pseudomonadota bacterium]
MNPYRTHNCDQIRSSDVGKEVILSGWVHNRRDHGGVLFLDLRDHYGTTQLVIYTNAEFHDQISRLQKENVIRVEGVVKNRDEDTLNPEINTGEVEVEIEKYEIIGPADPLPFSVFPEDPTSEELRLKYRFLDLRRAGLHNAILLRSKIIAAVRDKMTGMGFNEFQTPLLTSSSPEGARDFLVPSRLHPGKFYALPQAPQQFKQLLMIAGFDRYFQIAPCFRDEDARANRSPGEFYQVDIEMSFVTQDEIFIVIEKLLGELFCEFSDSLKRVDKPPFVRIPFCEAMNKYGSDKPDLRIPIEIQDVTSIFAGTQFEIFRSQIAAGAVVRAIPVKGVASRGKPFCESMLGFAMSKQVGAKGLAYIIWKGGQASGKPLTNHLSKEEIEEIRTQCGLGDGDVVFFVCDQENKAAQIAGRVRSELGERLSLKIVTLAHGDLESTDQEKGVVSFHSQICSKIPELNQLKAQGAALRAICVRAIADKGDGFAGSIIDYAESIGAKGAFYIRWKGSKPVLSDNAKLLSKRNLKTIVGKLKPKDGDVAFFVYNKGQEATRTARMVRRKLADELDLPQTDDFKFCWIVDYPMYEKDEKTGAVQFSHNPFSMPKGGLEALETEDPLTILAYQYDIVCNGEELSSGAIRNHRPDIMYKAFEIAGYSRSEVDEKFGGMITSFKLGSPPHGGIAPGLDRIVMLLAGKKTIREVIAFPMNQTAQDLMMRAPRGVSDEQLEELCLEINLPDED